MGPKDEEGSNTQQQNEFLIAEYTSVRDEIISRVRSRRQLITAGVAATIAILGYGISSNPQANANTWTISIIPIIMAFLTYEVLRSDEVIYHATEFLREVEEEILLEDVHLGWESTYGGYTESRAGIHKPTAVVVAMSYIIFSALAVLFWTDPPEQLGFLSQSTLSGVYTFIFVFLILYTYRVYGNRQQQRE